MSCLSPNRLDLGGDSFADSIQGKLRASARPVREFGEWLRLLANLRKAAGRRQPAGQCYQGRWTSRQSRILGVVGNHAVSCSTVGNPHFCPTINPASQWSMPKRARSKRLDSSMFGTSVETHFS